jgi:hypothetical protein
MDIYLKNHAYKYAIEQMLLTLFPVSVRSIPKQNIMIHPLS